MYRVQYYFQSVQVVQVIVVLQQLTMSGIWFLSSFFLVQELYTAPNVDLNAVNSNDGMGHLQMWF